MFWRAGLDSWCRTLQSVNNQHAAVWDMVLVFFFLKGGVSLPRFVSKKERTNAFQTCCWYPFTVGEDQQLSCCLMESCL